jgi:tellurite resistance protein TehA-like permease
MNGSEKVDPFPTPSFLSDSGGSFSLPDVSSVFPAIFAIAFFIWVVYTLVVTYHWIRYGHRSLITVPMLVLHVVVSGTLMLLAVAGLR